MDDKRISDRIADLEEEIGINPEDNKETSSIERINNLQGLENTLENLENQLLNGKTISKLISDRVSNLEIEIGVNSNDIPDTIEERINYLQTSVIENP